MTSNLVSVQVINNKQVPATTSLQVANKFGKEHHNVIKKIKLLIKDGLIDALNFEEISYKDAYGRSQPMYILDELATTVLTMGFTGSEAGKFKVDYVKEFIRMREALATKHPLDTERQQIRLEGKVIRNELTDVISKYVDLAISQGSKAYRENPSLAFSNLTRMVYKCLGLIVKVKDIRDVASPTQLSSIKFAEEILTDKLTTEISKGTHYKDIYVVAKLILIDLSKLMTQKQKLTILPVKKAEQLK